MIKTILFDINEDTDEINDWLKHNPNITIISANTFANHGGWGYIILYKEGEAHE